MLNRVPPPPLAESLEPRTLLAATPSPQLVADIDPGNQGSNPTLIADVGGGVAYVSTMEPANALWRTDGTPGGTTFVGSIQSPHSFVNFGGRLYFASFSTLYSTDGTAAGTVNVSNKQSRIFDIRAVGGHLLLLATQYSGSPSELWATDGTFAGTLPFTALGGPRTLDLQSVTPTEHLLYFTAFTPDLTARALWVTDGTPAGTTMLMRLAPDGSTSGATILGTKGDTVYFIGDDGVHGRELWQSDGTVAGTTLVTELVPGAGGVASVGEVAAVGDRFYFAADDVVHGSELWVTDGTAAGTRLVDDALPGAAGAAPHSLRVVGNSLYFVAPVLYPDDGDADTLPQAVQQLWRTDGTAAGTVALAAVDPSQLTVVSDDTLFFTEPGAASGQVHVARTGPSSDAVVRVATFSATAGQSPAELTAFGGRLYFVAGTSASGVELWSSDGTAAGTGVFRDLEPGAISSNPDLLTPVGNQLLFEANDPLYDRELFSTDGTAAGTQPVDLYSLGKSSLPANFVAARHALFFTADPKGTGDRQLLRTDGTAAGTLPLTTTVGTPPLTPAAGTAYGSIPRGVVFSDGDGNLWLADGTPDGTLQIHKFLSGAQGAPPSGFTTIGDVTYFSATDNAHGTELWRSDGTRAGTYLLRDVASGTASSSPRYLTAVGNTLYFFTSAGSGLSLWTSDGTANGTLPVAAAGINSSLPMPAPIAAQDGRLYFVANDGTHGRELWVSDGTRAGTHMVADVVPGAGGAIREGATIAEAGGGIYFVTGNLDSDIHLFRLDEATQTLTDVKQIPEGRSGEPYGLLGAGDQIYFINEPSYEAWDLWVSDGTTAGTRVARTFLGGINNGPHTVIAYDGRAYLTASDTADGHGVELWSSDGTAGGTVRVTDLAAGAADTRFYEFREVNGSLYSAADDYVHGAELWVIPGPAPTATPAVPAGVDAHPLSASEVRVSWSATPAAQTAFRVERGTSPAFVAFDVVGRTLPEVTTLIDRGLSPGVTYYYRVVAYSPAGEATSAVDDATPPTGAPRAPADLHTDGIYNARIVPLRWTDLATNETGYRLERSPTADFATIDLSVMLPPDTTTYADTSPLRYSIDWYRVVALGPAPGVESVGAYLRVTTPDLGPLPPSDLKAVRTSPKKVTLTWTDQSTDEGVFTIVRSRTPDFSSIDRTIVLPANTTTYDDTVVVATSTYYYRVNASNPGAASVYSNVASVTLPPANFTSGRLNSDLLPHALQFVFDANVGNLLASVVPVVRNLTTGQTLPAGSFVTQFSYPVESSAGATYVYTAPGGRLPEGRYHVELHSAAITGGVAAFDFAFMTGDVTGDGKVDFNDLVEFAHGYNITRGAIYSQGDFNYDRRVDFNDLVILAQRYNTGLPPVGAAASPAESASSFAADWARATSVATPPATATPAKKAVKPKEIFSVTPVRKAAPASPPRRAPHRHA